LSFLYIETLRNYTSYTNLAFSSDHPTTDHEGC
jgi:hypothetical protein